LNAFFISPIILSVPVPYSSAYPAVLVTLLIKGPVKIEQPEELLAAEES